MNRTLLFVIGGVILAGIIHIGVVLMVPLFATEDAWAKMQAFGEDGAFHTVPLPEAGAEPVASLDPRMLHAVCRFFLDEGPVRISASLPRDFWSIAIFDRRGRNMYSLNERSAGRSELDLAVITPLQMAELRQDPPEYLETAIVIELPIETGFAILRVFVADDSLLPHAVEALETADCGGSL